MSARSGEDPDAIRDGAELVKWNQRNAREILTTKIIGTDGGMFADGYPCSDTVNYDVFTCFT